MVEITIPIVIQIVQTIALVVGIVYYISIMRNQQRTRELALKAQEHATETRQVEVFMRLFEQLNDAETYTSWAELVNQEVDDEEYILKYDSSVNPVHFGKRAHLWFTFNTIGELLIMGIVKSELLFRLTLNTMVIIMWERWEHIIRATRVRENAPELWGGFEHLYNEMVRIREERDLPKITYPRQS